MGSKQQMQIPLVLFLLSVLWLSLLVQSLFQTAEVDSETSNHSSGCQPFLPDCTKICLGTTQLNLSSSNSLAGRFKTAATKRTVGKTVVCFTL